MEPTDGTMTPEMAIEQINKLVADKLQNLLTQEDLDSLKSQVEGIKSLELKSDDLMKAIAKMEGRLEAQSEKGHKGTETKAPKTVAGAMVKAYTDNVAKIKESVEKGQNFTLEVKMPAPVEDTITGDYGGNIALSTLEPEVKGGNR